MKLEDTIFFKSFIVKISKLKKLEFPLFITISFFLFELIIKFLPLRYNPSSSNLLEIFWTIYFTSSSLETKIDCLIPEKYAVTILPISEIDIPSGYTLNSEYGIVISLLGSLITSKCFLHVI